ncbi:MAG: hypothetical protein ACFE68_09060 [Candidatus Hodarchaeota archaeon]
MRIEEKFPFEIKDERKEIEKWKTEDIEGMTIAGKTFAERLEETKGLSDIFELVKRGVRKVLGYGRAGLNLGLMDLGAPQGGFIGAFYPVGSNIIVMNKTPLRRIRETNPILYKPYCFHVLLHEYVHSLGMTDEQITRKMAYEISHKLFGKNHIATKMAKNIIKYLPNLIYPDASWTPPTMGPLELVENFDRSNIKYYS